MSRQSGDGGFLSRWSQRKSRAREQPAEHEPDAESAAPQPEGGAPGESEGGSGGGEASDSLADEEVAALPDPDTLGPGDDFKPFLRRGVPEVLRRRALRRLWSVNPFFNVRDGLDDYDEDYTDAATVVPNLRTLFQPGKGMPEPERWMKPLPDREPDEPRAEPLEEQAVAQPEAPAEPPPAQSLEGRRIEEEREPEDKDPAPVRRGAAAQRRWGAFAPVEAEAGGKGGDA